MSSVLLQNVPFGGLASRTVDELVPFSAAITCNDCIVDKGQIEGRNAYRDVTNSTLGYIGAYPQLIDRFRPSSASARVVVVTGGGINTVTDPSTATTSDGSPSFVSAPFANTANISGTQLNDQYYFGTDEANVAWRRMATDYTVSSLTSYAQGAKPTLSAFNTLTPTNFSTLSAPTITGTAVYGTSGIPAAASSAFWRSVTKTGANDDPLTGITVQFVLGANFDATGYDWLAITLACGTTVGQGNTTGQIDVYLAEQTGGVAGTFVLAGSVWEPGAHVGPNLVYFPLTGMAAAQRSAVRYIKFVLSGVNGGKFALLNYLFLPARALSPESYYVDFYDSSTTQASPLTEKLDVTVKDSDVVLPTYFDLWEENDTFNTTGGYDDMLSSSNRRIFNRVAGKAMPAKTDIGPVRTFTGTSPAGYTGTLVPRLWKDTANGRRLVTSGSAIAAGAAYSLTDAGGLATLQNTLYKAGGAPPRCSAMAAFAGRIVAGYQNRIYVSSFLATSVTSNPYPQFPDIPTEVADGWSFDLASKAEQVQSITAGDTVYILTNYGLRVLTDLDAPLFGAPQLFHVFDRGACGRRAAIFAEDRFFWTSFDGIYAGQGRTLPVELSREIRRYITDTFIPGGSVTMGYQARCLYVFNGTKGLRYNFVIGEWTPMTLTDNVWQVCSWSDPPSTTGAITVVANMTDTFTETGVSQVRLENHTASGGQTWTAHPTNSTGICGSPPDSVLLATLSGNFCTGCGNGIDVMDFCSYAPASADYSVELGVVGWGAGPCARVHATNKTAYRLQGISNTQGQLQKVVAGTVTSLVTFSYDFSGASSRTLRVSCIGTTIAGTINGVPVATVTDSTITAAGKGGIHTEFGSSIVMTSFKIYTSSSTTIAVASGGTGENLWLMTALNKIGRWQSTVSRDMQAGTDTTTGTAIPDWSYSTGFDAMLDPQTAYYHLTRVAKITRLYADVTGDSVIAYLSKTMDTEPERSIPLAVGEGVYEGPADFTAYKYRLRLEGSNSAKVRRIMWAREALDTIAP